MLFNSWVYAVFLPAVLSIYYVLNRRSQNIFLAVASYVFYGWWDYRFCSLLFISTIVDYTCGRRMEHAGASERRLWLWVSCCVNLGILGFFKYFGFFVDSAERLLGLMGLDASIPTLSIILPVGISFYTFQTLSYTIDVYRGQLKPTRDIVEFALYVSFFPQLVAGPIERATRLLPQIQDVRRVDSHKLSSGAVLILIGLFRKVAIADGIAPQVNAIFENPSGAGSAELLVGLYLFSIQIYCDFAGYSDIARGTARLLGFELVENFQHPYFSTSITEFWRRWHVSLSSWLRDYLYIPLGGNRQGVARTYRNLFLTMLLGGLWHGANWTFVVWGALHGFYLAIHKLILGERHPRVGNRRRQGREWAVDAIKMLLTFHLVALTWIFFRASTFADAWVYLSGLVLWSGPVASGGLARLCVAGGLLAALDLWQYARKDHTMILSSVVWVRGAGYAIMVLAICALRSSGDIPFIYFQF
jgi:D-alanyl-lipoteichoic acid acyltransferase DltB (MBOAT superfamily)